MENRGLYLRIWRELAADKAMVFLVGPRQVGKTTLAGRIARDYPNHLYFNWDIARDRARFIENPDFFESVERTDTSTPLIVLDEIHKYRDWKNYLKGTYDRFHEDFQFLVSGSGRLDLYQKGGDSLAGRYYLFHLCPFSMAERGNKRRAFDEFVHDPLLMTMEDANVHQALWSDLSERSGFPEPFLSGRTTTYRRWSNTYSQQLIREDIRDLTGVKSILEMETLYFILPSKVGSPLSIPSLARDLKVSYNTVQSWISIFERFFLCFSVRPWTAKISRAIQKEKKVYILDTPRIQDPAARFENMVALELWRAITTWNDLGLGRFTLNFIKNKEQQEVDFIIADDRQPFLLIEAKLSDKQPSSALKKFQAVFNVPAVQLVESGDRFRILSNGENKILLAPAFQWLSYLP